MPSGVHKGKRVLITLDPELYETWVQIAKVLEVPVATALRQCLEESTPAIAGPLLTLGEAKEKGESMDDVMGRALWGLMKQMMEASKKDD